MSSISSTSSSAGEALVSLLRSSLTLGEAVPNGTSSSSQLSSLRTPVDIVDLSDRAQAILARAKIEKVAADKLTAQVQTARGADKSVETKSARDNASNFYETLSGNAPSKFTSADSNTNWGATSGGFLELSNYLQKLVNDHRRPDGTVSSFVETVNDVFNTPPSTPQEISDWRKNEEARAAQVAEGEPDPALKAQAQAYRDWQ